MQINLVKITVKRRKSYLHSADMVSIWLVTDLGYVEPTLPCPASCTRETNMPAAIRTPANAYQFVVTVRHCVFSLPFFYMVDLCGITIYNFFCFFFKSSHYHFLTYFCILFVSSSAVICNIYMTYASNAQMKLTGNTVRQTELLK